MIKKLILIIAFTLVSISAYSAPAVFYTDVTSGPNSGGYNDSGVWVSIYGHGFGSAQGASTVTVGGGAVSDYTVWSDTKLVVQIGPSATTGDIVVTVGGESSNGSEFTVRAGNIYFCTPAGTGDGSFASPFDPSDYCALLAAGEDGATCYFRTGTYDGEYAYPNWRSNFCFLATHSGTSGNENAFVGYPGEIATIYANTSGARETNFRSNDTSTAEYIVVAGFDLYALNNSISSSSHWRVINNRANGIHELTASGVIGAKGSNIKIFGNEITGGSSGNKLDHAFYPNEGSDIDFGWNYIHNNSFAEGPMISINHDTAWTSNWQFLNYRIHDNIIDVSDYPSRAMGVYETGPDSTIYFYNNIIIGNSGSITLPTILGVSANLYYYNNTIYDGGFSLGPVFDFYGQSVHDHDYSPLSITLRNNIVYANTNAPYYLRTSQTQGEGIIPVPTVENNLWYGLGAYDDNVTCVNGCPDTDSVEADPLFTTTPPTSAVDVTPQSGSPVDGAGTALSAVTGIFTTDYFGLALQDPVDIGAIQYISTGTITCYLDADGDLYSDGTSESVETCSASYYEAGDLTATFGDCNDSDAAINPGATEICGNGVDEDCDGTAQACATVKGCFIKGGYSG